MNRRSATIDRHPMDAFIYRKVDAKIYLPNSGKLYCLSWCYFARICYMTPQPVTQCPNNQQGQVTIFFATATVTVITLMAFIINIGIFVKAKINLQNAVDAAAYAGASVQSRQLTNISYLNWEMRNVYKEWMFKYYVLGNLNLRSVAGGDPMAADCHTGAPATRGETTEGVDFRMCSYNTTATAAKRVADSYNFPSVCIDFANTGSVGLCTRYAVPGLPRFRSSNVLGMDET